MDDLILEGIKLGMGLPGNSDEERDEYCKKVAEKLHQNKEGKNLDECLSKSELLTELKLLRQYIHANNLEFDLLHFVVDQYKRK